MYCSKDNRIINLQRPLFQTGNGEWFGKKY